MWGMTAGRCLAGAAGAVGRRAGRLAFFAGVRGVGRGAAEAVRRAAGRALDVRLALAVLRALDVRRAAGFLRAAGFGRAAARVGFFVVFRRGFRRRVAAARRRAARIGALGVARRVDLADFFGRRVAGFRLAIIELRSLTG